MSQGVNATFNSSHKHRDLVPPVRRSANSSTECKSTDLAKNIRLCSKGADRKASCVSLLHRTDFSGQITYQGKCLSQSPHWILYTTLVLNIGFNHPFGFGTNDRLPPVLKHICGVRQELVLPSFSGPLNVRKNNLETGRVADPDVRRFHQNRLPESLSNNLPSNVNSYWDEITTSVQCWECCQWYGTTMRTQALNIMPNLLKSPRDIPAGP
ncbi:hypothetical protein T265_06951 [Opisthorchis viverrini]|uniref:Uncharacterized protein n=1 Tax=Opisthorchis viverrini TaxID=6198 RepID=A0A074ZEJ0_OPIVI|nr:hypothetical protein T265_06951 [Opisthorchis viverrini]KER25661.1 hypothetical protein T265_06951 [Opisthorchis viverrini]